MTTRIVLALVYRIRWQFPLLAFWTVQSIVSTNGFMPRMTRAMGLMMFATMGTTLATFWARDTRVLPIDRAAAYRATWLTALLLPLWMAAVRTVLGALGALGIGTALSVQALVLASVFDVLFLGVALALSDQNGTPWKGTAADFFAASTLLEVFPILGLFVLAFATPEVVPTTIDGVRWYHLLGAVAAVVVAVMPLIRMPHRWPSLGTIDMVGGQRAETERSTVRFPAPPAQAMSGLRLLGRRIGIRASVFAVVAAIGSTLGAATIGRGVTFDHLAIWGVILSLFTASMVSGGLTTLIRHMKTLPVSTRFLVVAQTLVPAIAPVLLWVLLMAISVVASGTTEYRLSVLLLLSGTLSVTAALALRLASPRLNGLVSASPLLIALFVFWLLERPPAGIYWMETTAAVCWAFAFWLNHETLTTSSASSLNAAAFGPSGPQEWRR